MSATESPIFNPFRSDAARDRYLARYDARVKSWPIPSETVVVAADIERTFVRISGPADAPPLVLLPSEWSTSLMWMPMIKALSVNYRTYAIDNPYDFGRSTTTQPRTSVVDYMRWLDQVFGGLGLTQGVNLMGCSFGAWLAADYLIHRPSALAKEVWLSPPFAVLSPPLESYIGGPLSLGALLTPSRPSVTAYLRWLMPHAIRAAWFDEYVEDMVMGLRGFHARLSLTEPRMLSDEELGNINLPVLYVAGAFEQMCSVQAAVDRLTAAAPLIETAVIQGAGHELPLGQPELLTQRVLEFLGKP